VNASAPTAEPFAAQLRQLRERSGLTQEELAERAGLTPHAVSALERGARTRPYPHTVRSLADALGLDDDTRAGLIAAIPRRASSAPAEAAPTAHSARTLPVPTTALIGRSLELDAVAALLTDPGVRLVTLTGVGGVGKTRLALAAAARVAPAFSAVVWVPLAALDDPRLVLPAVGHALGLSGVEGPDVLGVVSAGLATGRTLLVVDNLEHLLDAASDLAVLLESCPSVTILASSRAALRVRGEREHAVPPLDVPRDGGVDPEAVLASPAGALLAERAQAVSPSFAVTPGNAGAVAGLCTRLAGIPLALELAAAKVRLLEPAALLDRLDTALSSGGARDLPARQRTMRATLDWSYDLLDDAEQRLFRRLAVFAGGFTLEAAEAVAEPGTDVLGVLERLVEHSLVQVGSDEDGARYGLLEPVLQYARMRLGEGEQAAAARSAHARYYLQLAKASVPDYRSERAVAALARSDREQANWTAALEHGLAAGEAELTARLCWALWLYWWLRGTPTVGRRFAERALQHDLSPYARARAALTLSAMAFAQGDLTGSAPGWEIALATGRATGDVPAQAHGVAGVGLVALAGGDLDAAERAFTEAIPLAAASDDELWLWRLAHIWLGTIRVLRGVPEQALPLVETALTSARARGDRLAIYIGLFTAAQAAIALGDVDAARRQLREGVSLSVETGDAANLVYVLEALAVVEHAQRQHRRVAVLLGAAQALRESTGGNVYGYYQPDDALREAAANAARAALGLDAYDDAVDQGRSLDLARAASFALSDRAKPPRGLLRLA
jgi:predicted ATPase/transcriptional regulator with XRE-family HTH domain